MMRSNTREMMMAEMSGRPMDAMSNFVNPAAAQALANSTQAVQGTQGVQSGSSLGSSSDPRNGAGIADVLVHALDTVGDIWGKSGRPTEDQTSIQVTPMTAYAQGDTGSNTGMIIGLSVAGLAVIGAIIYFSTKK